MKLHQVLRITEVVQTLRERATASHHTQIVYLVLKSLLIAKREQGLIPDLRGVRLTNNHLKHTVVLWIDTVPSVIWHQYFRHKHLLHLPTHKAKLGIYIYW
jgi:hypothetical protein